MPTQFLTGQVAISDPYPGGPTATTNVHQGQSKIIRLTGANFTTGGAQNLVAVLPADACITSMSLWIKTQLAGGSVSAATLSLGLTAGGTDFLSAISAFGTASTKAVLSPISGIFENYNVPWGTDLRIYATGTATTGNPTSGEMYLEISYTR